MDPQPLERAARRRRWLQRLTLLAVLAAVLYLGLLGSRVLWPVRYESLIYEQADAHHLDPDLVGAVIFAESRYRQAAVSPQGALGLMQLMPSTGQWIAEQLGLETPSIDDLLDPALNIRLGTWYLAQLLDRFGDTQLALWAYNAGPSNVDRWLETGDSPFPETSAYAERATSVRFIYRIYFRFPLVRSLTPSLVF